MKIINPLNVNEKNLVSSNIPDPTLWSGGYTPFHKETKIYDYDIFGVSPTQEFYYLTDGELGPGVHVFKFKEMSGILFFNVITFYKLPQRIIPLKIAVSLDKVAVIYSIGISEQKVLLLDKKTEKTTVLATNLIAGKPMDVCFSANGEFLFVGRGSFGAFDIIEISSLSNVQKFNDTNVFFNSSINISPNGRFVSFVGSEIGYAFYKVFLFDIVLNQYVSLPEIPSVKMSPYNFVTEIFLTNTRIYVAHSGSGYSVYDISSTPSLLITEVFKGGVSAYRTRIHAFDGIICVSNQDINNSSFVTIRLFNENTMSYVANSEIISDVGGLSLGVYFTKSTLMMNNFVNIHQGGSMSYRNFDVGSYPNIIPIGINSNVSVEYPTYSVYKSLAQTSEFPLVSSNWQRTGSMNKWAMFKGRLNERTYSDKIRVFVDVSEFVTQIAFFGLYAKNVQIIICDSGGVYFEKNIILRSPSSRSGWWSYYFEPIFIDEKTIIVEIPPSINKTIFIEITNGEMSAECGAVVLGKSINIGASNFGSSIGITDFSTKDFDVFGNAEITERAFSKKGEFDITFDTKSLGVIQQRLASFRATPVVWVGDANRPETIIYGFYRDLNIILQDDSFSSGTISIEGLT